MCSMKITPTIVTYTSLARPCAQKGDWRRVEALRDQMEKQGVKCNAFFLCGLLTAYANATPKECDQAEREFKRAVRDGVKVDDYVMSALERATGRNTAAALASSLPYTPLSSSVAQPSGRAVGGTARQAWRGRLSESK